MGLVLAASVASPWGSRTAALLTAVACILEVVAPQGTLGAGYLIVYWVIYVLAADRRIQGKRLLAFISLYTACTWFIELRYAGELGWEPVAMTAPSLLLAVGTATVGLLARQYVERAEIRETELLSGIDTFRRALSRELHDTAVHATTAMVMRANQGLAREDLDEISRNDLHFIVETGTAASASLRETLAALRSTTALSTGEYVATPRQFRNHLTQQVARMRAVGFMVDINDSLDTSSTPPRTLGVLSKCLVEIVNNVVRHGQAGTTVSLLLESTDTDVQVACSNIRNQEPVGPAHSHAPLGILGLDELTSSEGGSLAIDRSSERWTAYVRLPLPARK